MDLTNYLMSILISLVVGLVGFILACKIFDWLTPGVNFGDQLNADNRFDNLKHVGIVDGRDAFYHAQVTLGTNRSPMNPFWQHKIYGFRRLPVSDKK